MVFRFKSVQHVSNCCCFALCLFLSACHLKEEQWVDALPPDRLVGQVVAVDSAALLLVMEIEEIRIFSDGNVTIAAGDLLTLFYEEGVEDVSFLDGYSVEERRGYFERFAIGDKIHYLWTEANISGKMAMLKHERDLMFAE